MNSLSSFCLTLLKEISRLVCLLPLPRETLPRGRISRGVLQPGPELHVASNPTVLTAPLHWVFETYLVCHPPGSPGR